ncbi:DUF4870 domain-containing protein [Bacteroidota bacterium]
MENYNYYELPQPDEIPLREKEDAMGAYFMMFASMAIGLPLPIMNMIASIVYFYVNRSKGRFVKFHTLQSLLSQIPVTLLNAGGVFWLIRIFVLDLGFTDYFKGYVIMIIVANLIYFIYSIIGAVKARKGQFFYFWFFGPYAYQLVYRINETGDVIKPVNKPPAI